MNLHVSSVRGINAFETHLTLAAWPFVSGLVATEAFLILEHLSLYMTVPTRALQKKLSPSPPPSQSSLFPRSIALSFPPYLKKENLYNFLYITGPEETLYLLLFSQILR